VWYPEEVSALPWPFVGFSVSEADTLSNSFENAQRRGGRFRQILRWRNGSITEGHFENQTSEWSIIWFLPGGFEEEILPADTPCRHRLLRNENAI